MLHDTDMTLEQLEAEMERLRGLADLRRQQEKAEVIKVVIDLVTTHKLQVRDVFPPKPKTASVVPPKYRDTVNPENTWTGRGKMPVWLAKHVADGYAVDTFLIPAEPAAAEGADATEGGEEGEGAY